MDEFKSENLFVFFLCLEDRLPKSFYVFDKKFKDYGYVLVPVKIDQLQSLATTTEQDQLVVISSISDVREYNVYNQRIRTSLKYLLKTKRLTFIQLSSFSKIYDNKLFSSHKNYFFIKYPLDAGLLVSRIVEYVRNKNLQTTRWPGGKRASILESA